MLTGDKLQVIPNLYMCIHVYMYTCVYVYVCTIFTQEDKSLGLYHEIIVEMLAFNEDRIIRFDGIISMNTIAGSTYPLAQGHLVIM